jgi:glycosyltransferase involved in cell wall biosynthesis
MAFGLPIVATRWRSLPEMFPPNYPGLVAIRSPQQIAAALLNVITQKTGQSLRELFRAKFTLEAHLTRLADAIRSVEEPEHAPAALAPAPR